MRGVKRAEPGRVELSEKNTAAAAAAAAAAASLKRTQQSTEGTNKNIIRIMLKFPIHLDEASDKRHTAASSWKAAAEQSSRGTK